MSKEEKREIPPYSEDFSSQARVDAEGTIAEVIFNHPACNLDSSDARILGEVILKKVLWRFRKDLFAFPPKDPEKMVIPAEVHSDDRAVTVHFDALPWFEGATDEELLGLHFEGYGDDEISDSIARKCGEVDPEIGRLWQYLDFNPKNFGEDVGYACQVRGKKAREWIEKNRPAVYKTILAAED